MEKTKVFRTNRSQAVRLPKSVAFPEGVVEVEIVALGRSRVITPVGGSWDNWFDEQGVSVDFMPAREQPEIQDREL